MADLLKNQKAFFDYEILEKFEAGIELKGHEVKSLRMKMGSLAGARAIIKGSEAYIIGMTIPAYQKANAPSNYDEQRDRKILLKKNEIVYLASKAKTLTIIPLRVYTKGRLIKVEVVIARTKKKIDKRRVIREREIKRTIERALKGAG